MAAQGRVEDSLDEGTLARTRDACHHGKDIEWHLYVDASQIIHSGSLDFDDPFMHDDWQGRAISSLWVRSWMVWLSGNFSRRAFCWLPGSVV